MAAPTQAFPPWLSPAPVTATVDGTVVVQTTVLQFPQTYYGPSIPLGPGWVFGGSTFPASIATSFAASTTASTPSTSPASTLSQSQSTSTSASTTPTSASSTTSSTFASASSTTSSTPASSNSASPSSTNTSHGVSSSTRLAIILSTILGTLLLAVLLLVLCRIRRRQQRRNGLTGEGTISEWSIVSRSAAQHRVEAAAAAEEGEGAAFLTGEHGMQERQSGPTILPAWPKPPPETLQVGEPMALATRNTVSTNSGSGSKSDSSTLDSAAKREDIARFNASRSTVDAGSLFFNPGRGNGEGSGVRRSDEAADEEAALAAGVAAALASTPKDYATRPPGAGAPRVPARSPARPMARSATPVSVPSPTGLFFHPASAPSPRDEEHMYRDDVHRFGALRARESLDEDAEERFLPPPRLDPDRVFRSQSSSGSRGSWVYPDSPQSETDERATLLTARRVNVGPVSHPVLASSLSEKSKSLEGWVTPPNEDEGEEKPIPQPPQSPGSWAASMGMGGLTGFARGLGRLSWFRRMENEPGPSGTRHSSPTRSHRGPGSRPTSGVSFAIPESGSRPRSGVYPAFGSRPQSGVSFRGIDAELGMRAPGIRISEVGSGNGSGGSGSGKSGGTVYHSASSRPRTPFYVAGPDHGHHSAQLEHIDRTMLTPPPDLDLGQAGDTIRSVDMLDLPVPERALPFNAPVLPEPSSSRTQRPDTASSRGTGLAFPPGLVAVPKWDKGSHSGSSNREGEERDVLEDEPPQAGGEWSSLRSKGSGSDVRDEGNEGSRSRRGGPVTRSSTGEQAVRVVMGEPATSEAASISSGPRHPTELGPSTTSPRSPTGPFVLTPRVSLYASSQSDLYSHSGSGSHSSRPSQHNTLHSQELSQPSSSNHESEEGHPPPPPGAQFHRASLSAMGGVPGPPQLPPLRPLSHMQPMMERTNEDRETEDDSGTTTSRPGTGTSRPTVSEATHTGTFTSGTASTGAHTTVPSTTGSPGKR